MFNDFKYSFLRIIAGHLKGRKFDAPKGGDTVRPISDRVKESLFDILASRMENASILDLYSGTGAIGFEALSRGAKQVLYVEKDPRNVKLINENAEKLGLSKSISILRGSLPDIISKIRGEFNIIFIDPPFPTETIFEIMPALKKQNLVAPHTLIMVQRFRGSKELEFEGFTCQRKHRVGDSILWFFTLTSET
jgi:16S rRNA (guanine966-N2)-methyltransferase